jgi:hypothetical protein
MQYTQMVRLLGSYYIKISTAKFIGNQAVLLIALADQTIKQGAK